MGIGNPLLRQYNDFPGDPHGREQLYGPLAGPHTPHNFCSSTGIAIPPVSSCWATAAPYAHPHTAGQ